ncbi:hypothetical protein ES703_37683 [subsurface metagenome]
MLKYYRNDYQKVRRKTSKNKNPSNYITIFIIVAFSLVSGIPKLIHADSSYYLSLELGSRILEIKYINLPLWKETINYNSDPSDWFPGTSNQTGASSKNTFLSTDRNDSNTYGIFYQFFYAWFNINHSILSQNGYGPSYINENYTKHYYVWGYEYQTYYFSNQPLRQNWDYLDYFFTFRQPSDLSTALDDYNNFTTVVNNDPVIQNLSFSLPTVSGDEFLWKYFLKGLIIAKPINNYLLELVDALDCQNVTVQSETLIIYRKGIGNYRLEIRFNEQGFMDSLNIKTENNELIYNISSWYPKDVALIIGGIIIGGLIGLLSLSIYRKRKRLKFFKEH